MLGSDTVANHWWIVLLRGLLAIVFGVFALAFPASTVAAFVILFGAFSLAEGVVVLFTALRFAHPDSGRWWAMILQGIVGIGIGILTFAWPALTAFALALIIAAWALATGVLEIVAAFRMRKNVPGEIFLIVSGVLSVALGAFFAVFPGAALLTWVWVVAVYALIAGFALVGLAFRLRNMKTRGAAAT